MKGEPVHDDFVYLLHYYQAISQMNPTTYPEFIARFYDTIYHRVRDGVDNTFFINQALAAGGKVLEIGAGTGRLFMEALEKGVDIYAIDISPSMTTLLRSKLPPQQHFRVRTGDAVTMQWEERFDLIIAPFRVLSHIIETERQLRLLATVYEHLREKGRFIFDVFVPDPRLLANGIKDQPDFDGEYEPGRRLRRMVTSEPDIVNQLLKVTMKLTWDEGGIERREVWTFPMRFFYRYELEHLIRLSPLNLEIIYGDYRLNPLNEASREFVVVCSR